MALDLSQRLRVFLASAPQNVRSIEVLEVYHSAFGSRYYWKEGDEGVVTREDGSVVAVKCVAFNAALAGSEGDLDQQFTIDFDTTDYTDEFCTLLDAVPLTSGEKVQLVYREYLSDDLTTVQARVALQVESINYTLSTATLSAVSPRLNINRTGLLYAPRDIPMLRGFATRSA